MAMMLALEWYKHTPLPDAAPDLPPPPGQTLLSKRLISCLEQELHSDVTFRAAGVGNAAAGPMALVSAHLAVLRRNPTLCLRSESSADLAAGVQAIEVPAGISLDTLAKVVRAHYLDFEEVTPDVQLQLSAEVAALRAALPDDQLAMVESSFGPLKADAWMPLAVAINTRSFADCLLQVSGGIEIPAHRFIVCGVEDAHFFTAAVRWPGAGQAIAMPEGLTQEALHSLLRMRYGSKETSMDRILEMRHFAELFDWSDVKNRCELALETLLADAQAMDSESLLAVVTHSEESASLPAHIKAAALAAAVRQWTTVTDIAEAALPKRRCLELDVLSRIRNRDGHVCGSLEEYMIACADDLTEWERSLVLDAPLAARKQIEYAWRHWHQLLYEYGHIGEASKAEAWRERVRSRREELRQERAQGKTAQMRLQDGRCFFEASFEWLEVPGNAICPGGLEYRCDMATGRNYARRPL